ncbi:uncharacterized protein [Pseudochaenichthys georgianus]|uniref:uncharacterized protein isoform X2 n=1 Tax=Pseudochaenichthys georgianus TaxID=52239 RepID=UPI00146EBD87|nr:uncharacterized protein LOC117452877 isoform X2 [Pseudochaenichthys georgianus]
MSKGVKRCAVVGCKNRDKGKVLHAMPSLEKYKNLWLEFIFQGHVPEDSSRCLLLCSQHFAPDMFMNLNQVKEGYASRLRLKPGAIPTIQDQASEATSNLEAASTSHTSCRLPVMIDSACQTDPPKHRTVRTQLSLSTLRGSRRSTAVQTIDSSNFDVWTSNVLEAAPSFISTPTERPSKRRRVDPEEKEEEEEDGSFSVVASDGLDDTYDPAESVTNDTEKTDMFGKEHIPYNIKTYIVYETCIMELFEMCPVCQRVCDVQTRRMGTFLSVEQLCPHCQFSRLWNSQPIVRSTPAGNLQLSTSVYINGESFFKLEKVLKAINLQLFEYDTFLRHAKMFIEPAIVSNFKTSQEMMLRRLSEEDKIIPGGDLRSDSPGHSERSGSHTTMDLKTNNVVDIPLFKSDEVGGSCQMEKEGLERGLALLQEHGCLDDLMALIFDENFVDPAPFKEEILKVTITEDLCAQDERPVKEEVIESFVTQVKTEAF